MKIIDNKKDYYDYLAGIWGIDEKIVYDRRGSETLNNIFYTPTYARVLSKSTKLTYTLVIGNIAYEVAYFKEKPNPKYYRWETERKNWKPRNIEDETTGAGWYYDEHPIKNRKYDDIMYLVVSDYTVNSGYRRYYTNSGEHYTFRNPILRDFNVITAVFNPQFIWDALYTYISSLKDKDIIDSRTDVQKLESHGFDKKISFRNVK